MTLMNLGHHTRTLSKRADPWSRDLDKSRRNGVMRQNYLLAKKLVSAAEDDHLHLNFEPVLSRLMGAQREGDEHSARALHLICYMFPYMFHPKKD